MWKTCAFVVFLAITRAQTIAGLLFNFLLLILAVLVIGLLLWLPGHVADTRKHPNAQAIKVCSYLSLLLAPLWLVAIIWAYTGAQSVVIKAPPQRRPTPVDDVDDWEPDRTGGFPVVNKPGKWKVSGVDRESKFDTTWYCTADSSENARIKAELEGILVTAVEPAP